MMPACWKTDDSTSEFLESGVVHTAIAEVRRLALGSVPPSKSDIRGETTLLGSAPAVDIRPTTECPYSQNIPFSDEKGTEVKGDVSDGSKADVGR
jgi:hypothetical protein